MHVGILFLWIAVILFLAKISALVERAGQPAVIGELLVGILLGNLPLVGIDWMAPMVESQVMRFLAELGVVVLLFEVGLESKVEEMMRVGFRVFLVAVVGAAAPFLLGTFVLAPLFLSAYPFGTHLFLGAVLTATSVGITVRVFEDLGQISREEARIVLGAAVLDDVLGLILLTVCKGIVESGSIGLGEIGRIVARAVGFLGLAIIGGQFLAPGLGRVLSRINPGIGMKLILAVCLCLLFSYAAEAMGLAPIVGAFAAGLVLTPVHFRHFDNPAIIREIQDRTRTADPSVQAAVREVLRSVTDRHVQDLIKPLSYFLVPIFFVMTGMSVKAQYFFDPAIWPLTLAITVLAFGGKLAAGIFAGNVNRWIVGWGLVPRGEVALIFAATGKALGVIPEDIFSMAIIMIAATTLAVPPVLNRLLKKEK